MMDSITEPGPAVEKVLKTLFAIVLLYGLAGEVYLCLPVYMNGT